METTADRILQTVRDAGVPERKIRSTLAKLCGISPQAVRDWFEGKTKEISQAHLINIAMRYGVSLEWLITGKGPQESAEMPRPFRQTAATLAQLLSGVPDEEFEFMAVELAITLEPRDRFRLGMAILQSIENEIE